MQEYAPLGDPTDRAQTCYYDEESDVPVYIPFFQDQAEVKRQQAKQFIKYLKERQSKVCLPVTKRPDVESWGTDLQAIVIALELEKALHKHLQDLKSLASKNSETDLLEFLKKFLDKQKRNIKYLEYQHSYQKDLERLTAMEGSSEQLAAASGKEA
ncbi:soma ferritin-like isoform X1 [Ursus maritimus]|uniref:Ferritin n=1 Tax=Ursus maritimus TaxID=29073 RepID=A0A8M1F1A4_URSMA|nr:soma ferritin-like isoform X1 [Ursus maritimus]XP_044237251.1 soma ferritin-like [Ursus arctos]XP_044237253.1 soma ferritin-like [Ursus arctos]